MFLESSSAMTSGDTSKAMRIEARPELGGGRTHALYTSADPATSSRQRLRITSAKCKLSPLNFAYSQIKLCSARGESVGFCIDALSE